MSRVFPILLAASLFQVGIARADETSDASPTLDPQRFDLSPIADRTDLAFEESDLYYGILDHVRHVPDAELRTTAADVLLARWRDSPRFSKWPQSEFPLFYDLTQHPEEYRGQPIAMHGHLVRLVKYAAGPNEHGIETLYEGWLVTPDAETHPTTVVCTEIPPGMPIGEELIDGVSVTGYFFKLHTYPSRDKKTRFAPMILARTMRWSPPDQAATGWPVSQPIVISAIVILAVLGGVIAWVAARRARAEREARFRESVPEDAPKFLNDLTP